METPQYLLDSIVLAVRNELNSTSSIKRFEELLEKYYESNTELISKIEAFHQALVKGQESTNQLLQQIIDNKMDMIDCPNTEDISDIKKSLDTILYGEEFKVAEQARDLKEAGFAKKMRNLVITVITMAAIASAVGGLIGGYMSLKQGVTHVSP